MDHDEQPSGDDGAPGDEHDDRPWSEAALALARRRMIDEDLASRGITDQRVLDAMLAVPRERFVPPHLRHLAYDDNALPIAANQTISQPYVVAWMSQALELTPTDRVLEVGAGSGYGAAVLARLCRSVVAIERHHDLVVAAADALRAIGATNVTVVEGDGSLGYAPGAPYDAISVTASAPDVVDALVAQLADGGRMVAPVGDADEQALVRVRRVGDRCTRERLGGVRFVPLIGAGGWPDQT